MTRAEHLVILSPLAASEGSRGGFVLTQKFVDGVLEYCRHWPEGVRVLVPRAAERSNDLDHVDVMPGDIPFELAWLEDGATPSVAEVREAAVVLATLVPEQADLANACASAEPAVPIVYMTEYSLRTRKQIIAAETGNALLRWRRQLWTTRLERRYEEAVRLATGIQCNGTPTFDAYHAMNEHAMLFFDSRIRRDMVVAEDAMQRRTARLLAGEPLRLAFSGRLIRMKGAQDLPAVARELKARGVAFTMDIFGAGVLENEMRRAVASLELEDCVRLRGVLHFERELVPFMSSSADLFVCCHPQGDPSCTYLETMSCGVPIAGYANEAWSGLSEASGAGWVTPIGDPKSLAARIASLDEDRRLLADAAHASRSFAMEHTFERTMERRSAHLHECASLRRVVA